MIRIVFLAVCWLLGCNVNIHGWDVYAPGSRSTTAIGSHFELGKVWILVTHQGCDPERPEKYTRRTVVGDTLVEGHLAAKILVEDIDASGRPLVDSQRYSVQYEENGAIYSFSASKRQYVKLIDCNADAGDIIDSSVEVLAVDYIVFHGILRKVLTVMPLYAGVRCYWIEGIGANQNLYINPSIQAIGHYTEILECRLGDSVLYTKEDLDNMTSSTPEMGTEVDNSAHPVYYDLKGNKVVEPESGRIYINNRKKILKR